MTQKKLSSNGSSLPKAPSEKAAFILFIERLLNLQSDCSVVDLDIPIHIQSYPPLVDLGVWLDSWHTLADALGSSEDAISGVDLARDILYYASCRISNMIFSADGNKPPLDQFGPPDRGLRMLFEASTCYKTVIPICIYHGRVVYWGSNPNERWSDQDCKERMGLVRTQRRVSTKSC